MKKTKNREQQRKKQTNKKTSFKGEAETNTQESRPRAWGVPCSWGAELDIPGVGEQSPDRM